jgi:hypothetical protein
MEQVVLEPQETEEITEAVEEADCDDFGWYNEQGF